MEIEKMGLPAAVQRAAEKATQMTDELLQDKGNTGTPAPGTGGTEPAPKGEDDTTEHRFKVLKGKYDAEVPRLQGDLKERDAQIADLQRQLAEAQAKPPAAKEAPKSLFTDEEREQWGDPFFEVVGKAAQDVVAKQRQSEQASVSQSFLAEMDRRMPQWRSLNEDPKFLAFLGARSADLQYDAARGDVRACLATFQEYLNTPGAHTPTTIVEPGQGSPSGGGGPKDTGSEKRIWTRAEINAFYADKAMRRLKVSAEEAAILEEDILLATAEGRIQG